MSYAFELIVTAGIFMLTTGRSSTAPSTVPKFTVEPQSAVVRPGSSLTLTCAVRPEAAPSTSLRWTFNGTALMTSQQQTGRRRAGSAAVDVRHGTLRITSFSHVTHDGVYRCVATSPQGVAVSREARLQTAVLHAFLSVANSSSSVVDVVAVEGGPAIFRCPPPDSRPPANIEFYYTGQKMPQQSTRHVVLPSGSLLLSAVNRDDAGLYRCAAHNELLDSTTWSPVSYRLHVQPKLEEFASSFIWSSPDYLSVTQGQNMTLECIVTGNPLPQVTWEKYGGQLPVGRHSTLFGSLGVTDVQRFDAGTYLCKTSNGIGPQITRVIAVNVLEPPVIESAPSDQTLPEGSTVTMRCRVYGTPRPTIQWLHNGSPLMAGPSIQLKDTAVSLSSIEPHQSGVYQCIASNSVGTVHAASRLTVLDSLESLSALITTFSPSVTSIDDYDDEAWFDVGFNGAVTDRFDLQNRTARNRNTELATPSRPVISRLSDTSVYVSWSLPPAAGSQSPAVSYKVQHRIVSGRSQEPAGGDLWQTAGDNIPWTQTSLSVAHLQPGSVYRFRVIAIYANGEIRHSQSSVKVILGSPGDHSAAGPLLPAPVIVEVRALSNTEMFVAWQDETAHWLIDGFYIYFVPFGEQLELKQQQQQQQQQQQAAHGVTLHPEEDSLHHQQVVGSTVRHAVVSNLNPSMAYSFRMQSYSDASGVLSRLSNAVIGQTLATDYSHPLTTHDQQIIHVTVTTTVNAAGNDNAISSLHADVETLLLPSNQPLLITLGVIAGFAFIIFTIFLLMCVWKHCRQFGSQLEITKGSFKQVSLHQTSHFTSGPGSWHRTTPIDRRPDNNRVTIGRTGGEAVRLSTSFATDDPGRNMSNVVNVPQPAFATVFVPITHPQSQYTLRSDNQIKADNCPVYTTLLGHDDSLSSSDIRFLSPSVNGRCVSSNTLHPVITSPSHRYPGDIGAVNGISPATGAATSQTLQPFVVANPAHIYVQPDSLSAAAAAASDEDERPLARWQPLCNIAERSTQDGVITECPLYGGHVPEFYNDDFRTMTPMTSSCSSRATSAMTSPMENCGFGFSSTLGEPPVVTVGNNHNAGSGGYNLANNHNVGGYKTLAEHVSAGAYQIKRTERSS